MKLFLGILWYFLGKLLPILFFYLCCTPTRQHQWWKELVSHASWSVTVGFLYGAGAETLIFVTGTSGKYPKLFVSRQKNQSQLWIPRKPRKIGVWVSGAEIQTSAVDTRTAVWVSTPEKFSKIVLGKNSEFFSKV